MAASGLGSSPLFASPRPNSIARRDFLIGWMSRVLLARTRCTKSWLRLIEVWCVRRARRFEIHTGWARALAKGSDERGEHDSYRETRSLCHS